MVLYYFKPLTASSEMIFSPFSSKRRYFNPDGKTEDKLKNPRFMLAASAVNHFINS